MVEKLQELATQGAEMRTLASAGLVGKTVTYTDPDNVSQTGVVDKVKQTPGGTVLVVGGKDVALPRVTEVTTTSIPAATAPPAPTPSTPPDAATTNAPAAQVAPPAVDAADENSGSSTSTDAPDTTASA
jgi:hypothetical protein